MMRTLITLTVMLPLTSVAADKTATAATDMFSAAYLMQVFGSLIVVIGLMFAVLWGLRRFNGVGGRAAGGQLQVISSVGLGQRERAVLVRAGDQQLLLGVAPGSVRTLHVFSEPLSASSAPADQPAEGVRFADVWKHAMGQRGDQS